MALSITSTTVAAILCGYFLGWTALVFYVLIYLTSAITGNLISKGIDKGRFLQSLTDIGSIEKFLGAMEKEQIPLIVIARISPVFPFSVMNVLLAAVDFKLSKILIGSIIGMLPRTMISFYIGTQLSQLKILVEKGLDNNFLEITAIVLVIISIAGLYFYINKILKKIAGGYI